MRSALSRAFQAAIALSAGGLVPPPSAPPGDAASPHEGGREEEGGVDSAREAGCGQSSSSPLPQLASGLTKSTCGGGRLGGVGAGGLEAIHEEEGVDREEGSRPCSTAREAPRGLEGAWGAAQGGEEGRGEHPPPPPPPLLAATAVVQQQQQQQQQQQASEPAGSTLEAAGAGVSSGADALVPNQCASPVNWLLGAGVRGSSTPQAHGHELGGGSTGREGHLQPCQGVVRGESNSPNGSVFPNYQMNSNHALHGPLPALVPAPASAPPPPACQQQSSPAGLGTQDSGGVPLGLEASVTARGREGGEVAATRESCDKPAALHQVQHQCVNPVLSGLSSLQTRGLLREPDEP
jgi:hypothetical protein